MPYNVYTENDVVGVYDMQRIVIVIKAFYVLHCGDSNGFFYEYKQRNGKAYSLLDTANSNLWNCLSCALTTVDGSCCYLTIL